MNEKEVDKTFTALQNSDPITKPFGFEEEKRGFFGNVAHTAAVAPAAIGGGLANAVVDSADFFTDLGVYGSVLTGRAASAMMGKEHDYAADERILKKKDALDKKIINYFGLQADDVEGETAYNFIKGTTESIAKFATVYKSLGKTGLGVIAKSGISGATEGLMDNPDGEGLQAAQAVQRQTLAAISPELADDYDAFMSPDTNNYMARQILRRVNNGIDIGLLSMATPAAGKAVGIGISKLPQKEMALVKDQFIKAMQMGRKIIEKKPATKAAQFEVKQGTAEEVFNLVDDVVVDPTKSLVRNISDNIKVTFDSSTKLTSPEHYSAKLADYEKKLMTLVPQIKEKVVSMAKVQGVEEKALLRTWAKELGQEETNAMTDRGLREVLQTQAHNILLEQEGIKFATAARNFYTKAIDEKEFLDVADGFLIAQSQRMSLLTKAGRLLKVSQNNPIAVKIGQIAKDSDIQTDDLIKKVTGKLDGLTSGAATKATKAAKETAAKFDTATRKAFAENMAENLKIKEMLDLPEDDFTAALIKSLSGGDDLVKQGKKMGLMMQASDAMGRFTQANLLTSTATLAQNTLGTGAMQTMRIGEAYIQAGLKGPGTGYFMKANALFTGTIHGYAHSISMLAKTFGKGAKRNVQQGMPWTSRYRQLAGDIPMFDSKQARQYLQLDKSELAVNKGTGNALYDGLNSAKIKDIPVGKGLTSNWVFDIISGQDTMAKTAFAYGQMKSKMYSALYIDDVFDLATNPKDLKAAKGVLSKMLMNGTDEISVKELAKTFDPTKAMDIARRMEKWRATATKESMGEAVDSVFQKELTGSMKFIRDGLQEKMPLGKMFVPFFTTPVRILDESLQRMPMIPIGDGAVGLPIHPKIYKEFMNPATRNEAVSKVIMGNTIALAGQKMAEAGIIQPVPSSTDAKAFLSQSLGRNPGSIMVDGKSIQTSWMGPIHNILGIGASSLNRDDIYKRIDHMDEETVTQFYDIIGYNMMNLSSLIMEQPWATGVEQITEILDFLQVDMDDESQKRTVMQNFGRFAGQKMGNLIPSSSLQRQVSNNMMETQQKADGMIEHMQSQFAPWMLESNAVDGYYNLVEPTKGAVLRYKNMKQPSLADKLLDEISFIPNRPKFRRIYRKPSNYGEQNPPVGINLAEMGLWNEFAERVSVRLGNEIKDFMGTNEYKENINNQRIDLNQRAVQSIINAKERETLSKMVDEYGILSVKVEKELNKTIKDKQKGVGHIPLNQDQPTFLGE